nr:hypothetical protein StreXyl84_37480 [Streptomyces sp. Xyl84]
MKVWTGARNEAITGRFSLGNRGGRGAVTGPRPVIERAVRALSATVRVRLRVHHGSQGVAKNQ